MKKSMNAIGMMDSGIGGLTVLKAVKALLSKESIVFVGDNARNPYGPRRPEEVVQFARQIAHFLIEKYDIKVFVIACNTATACALPVLQKELNIPVIGVIDSGAKAAVKTSQTGRIGLIATEGTVKSAKYQDEIHSLKPGAKVFAQAEPDFVQLVEKNTYQTTAAEEEVAEHLQDFGADKIDTLILGCTHFPLLTKSIQKAVGSGVKLVDAGAATAVDLAKSLKSMDLLDTESAAAASYELYTTGPVDAFEVIATDWLGQGDWHFAHLPVEELEQK
ncbi:glutamate racemase [Fructobacillus sp. CRL 2054]|uniref:glutamate racemase n=1 Tax=Fructobacillus sp. CRL 2054 TaxID=2763007 RepID=UPI002379CD1A|nr:glutamate racemase [Fructobacillus sp. CRL 2054]MDD9138435.1 glutamate racemase [Fructobacillus sp. CRL 2054]